jgi:hypothetical protein
MWRYLVSAQVIISLSLLSSTPAFAQTTWRKIAPFRTASGTLPAPKLKDGCKYRFAWQVPTSANGTSKVTFESGNFFTENQFYLSGYGFVRTEITYDDLSLLRPLSTFGTQIEKTLADLPPEAKPVFYLSWESGDTHPNPSATGNLDLIITFLYPNGASNNFINLRPAESISIEESCPNGILPAPTPTADEDRRSTPKLPSDISLWKPRAATITSLGKSALLMVVRSPRLSVGIKTYETKITRLATNSNQPPKIIKINTLGGRINRLKPGRYHLSYRVIATNGQASRYSEESNIVRVK